MLHLPDQSSRTGFRDRPASAVNLIALAVNSQKKAAPSDRSRL